MRALLFLCILVGLNSSHEQNTPKTSINDLKYKSAEIVTSNGKVTYQNVSGIAVSTAQRADDIISKYEEITSSPVLEGAHAPYAVTTEMSRNATPFCKPACTFGATCVWNATNNPVCQCLKCNEDVSIALPVIGNDDGRCKGPVSACNCYADKLDCRGTNVEFFHALPYERITKYDFSGTSIKNHLNSSSLRGLQHLKELSLASNSISVLPDGIFSDLSSLEGLSLDFNSISVLPDGIFSDLSSLETLDLGGNSISVLPDGIFSDLSSLERLYLFSNRISVLPDGIFSDLSSLETLYLFSNRISVLPDGIFSDLSSLETLHLWGNRISVLPDGIFSDLSSLETLDLGGNSISVLPDGIFSDLSSLETLFLGGNIIHAIGLNIFGPTPNLRMKGDVTACCLAYGKTENCSYWESTFSSCHDLLSGTHLKVSIWMLAILVIGFNLVAFVSKLREESTNKVNTFLISQLALADMIMGLYLAAVGIADVVYKDEYFLHDFSWRQSIQCKATGILAVTGSEASVFILVLITADRYVTLVFPCHPTARITINQSRVAVLVAWVLAITLAMIPVFGLPYFGGEFYSTSTVCLALPLSNDKPRGWEYAIGVFSVLNLVCFLGILAGYAAILRSVYNSSGRSSRVSSSQENRAITIRLLAIILTDFCCWGPLSFMGFLSLSSVEIPSSVFAYVAVFVLPINSALNPFIYTFTSSGSIQTGKQYLKRIRTTFRKCCTYKTQSEAQNIEMVSVNHP